jgi:site-specific DNA-cytosine methylase
VSGALTYVELFAGAGGLSLGLDRAGWHCAGHAEIEPHARAVLRKHWPDTPLYGDVSTLDGTQWRGITLLSGGSPCQDLSIAGKREGLTGRRSGLFHHQVRLWRESEAPLLLWENVVGALSSNQGKDFARIISSILGEPVAVPRDGKRQRVKWATAGFVEGTRGVALAWRVLDLRRFGPPQRRRRVFIVAVRGGVISPRDVLFDAESVRGDSDAGGTAGQADPGAAVVESGVRCFIPWASQNARIYSGEGDAPTLSANAGKAGLNRQAVLDTQANPEAAIVGAGAGGEQGVMPTLYGFGHGWQGHHNSTYSVLDTRALAVNISDSRVSLDSEMGTLGARSGGQEVGAQTRGVVLVVDKQGGQVDVDVSPTLKTDLAHQMGPVVAPEPLTFKVRGGVEVDSHGKVAGKGYLGAEGEAFTLGVSQDQYVFDARGNGDGQTCNTLAGDHQNRVTDYTAIVAAPRPRRLMPVECERLMSWPDGWTEYGIDEQGREYRLKDTPRYKCCGNGVGSVVAEWIGRRILTQTQTETL